MSRYHLAQANVARMLAPLDDPLMQDFAARLEPVNELADASPGFVWRYETEEGDTTEAEVFGDEKILFNMSVWETVEALEAFTYRSNHVAAVQKRSDWFERPTKSPLVLWWIEAGHLPDIREASSRFDMLWEHGPTTAAFTFRHRFAAPDAVRRVP